MLRSSTGARVVFLVLPVFAYVGVAIAWRLQGIYRITGDEPHYLLIADSLLRRHDLRVIDDYFADTPVHRAAGVDLAQPEHLTHVLDGYSIHAIGVPILLLLPYRIAGPHGARVFMALVAGLIPFVLYRAARRVTASPARATWLACTVAIGLPVVAAANQISPDLLAGMLILYVAGTVAAAFAGESDHPAGRWGTVVAIAFLPWLHVRLVPPAVLLLSGYLYGLRVVRRERLRRLVPVLACVAGSLAVLAAYHVVAFGRPMGPYDATSLSHDPRTVGTTLLGLHFDVVQGLFLQQPLLLLGLAGVVPFLRRDPRLGILLAAIYVSVVVPNAMHINWYGGYSLVGRFAWPVILLWIFPTACAIERARRPDRVCVGVCVASLALQIVLATKWLTVDSVLMARRAVPAWAPTGVYAALLDPAVWLRLPSFHPLHDVDAAILRPANWAAVTLAVLLVALGWPEPRASRRVRAAVVAGLAIALTAVVVLPPPLRPWSIGGDQLPGIVGRVDGTARTAVAPRDAAGMLAFGPYLPLAAGTYEASLVYESVGEAALVGRWQIVLGGYRQIRTVAAAGELAATAPNGGTLRRKFVVPARGANVFQFRVQYPGYGQLRVQQLTLTPVAIPALESRRTRRW